MKPAVGNFLGTWRLAFTGRWAKEQAKSLRNIMTSAARRRLWSLGQAAVYFFLLVLVYSVPYGNVPYGNITTPLGTGI
jgi:hypothetical protein